MGEDGNETEREWGMMGTSIEREWGMTGMTNTKREEWDREGNA